MVALRQINDVLGKKRPIGDNCDVALYALEPSDVFEKGLMR